MFNIGTGEIALIAVVALLILGPKRLPEMARGIGKFVREFRRQTDDIRGVVEKEFYRMDQDLSIHEPPPTITAASDLVSLSDTPATHEPAPPLPEVSHSQLTSGMASATPETIEPAPESKRPELVPIAAPNDEKGS
jgi:sec-independent protein translocase protein TatB